MKDSIKIEKKDYIKLLFARTMIQQKSKILPNKKIYKRQKYNIRKEEE